MSLLFRKVGARQHHPKAGGGNTPPLTRGEGGGKQSIQRRRKAAPTERRGELLPPLLLLGGGAFPSRCVDASDGFCTPRGHRPAESFGAQVCHVVLALNSLHLLICLIRLHPAAPGVPHQCVSCVRFVVCGGCALLCIREDTQLLDHIRF